MTVSAALEQTSGRLGHLVDSDSWLQLGSAAYGPRAWVQYTPNALGRFEGTDAYLPDELLCTLRTADRRKTILMIADLFGEHRRARV